MKLPVVVASTLCGVFCLSTVQAASIDLSKLTQANDSFKALSKDLSSALSYKAVAPAEPLGLTGFDVGLELTVTSPENSDKWAESIGEDKVDWLPVPKLHLHKGLPLGIDLGAVVSSVPGTGVSYAGGEIRYSFVSGNVAIPAIAIRGTYTTLIGVDDFSMNTKGLELSVSKGFAMLTPYVGIGNIWATSTPEGDFANSLDEVELSQSKMFAGLNINMGLMNIAFEADKTGDSMSYSGKLGLRF